MSSYWFWYKVQRTVMWLALLSMSSLALLGLVIGGFLFWIQRSHWIPCEQDVISPEWQRHLADYAQAMGASQVSCQVYWIDNEPNAKRERRRGNYRVGISQGKHRIQWSYWSLNSDGSLRPESPGAYALVRHSSLAHA
ncbi:MAG: hypothetical protein C7B44_11535 [Sulfobacillus thermosulfidooxidans]|uniref:Uncharacterized protein n=1 Tax=Sulfobacillus thermotolerans TaxID=338644 RepID=A0ABN5GXH5_9FIRM|nr:hypothetical protein [Sulfobacillus sp. hq2]AUW93251.1 hypothetical protein BXT84_04180 [Sulfobacillus thermotolerans]MCY0906902.1 hypothetical protein [Sulfobacillus thermotolerans]POB11670.1 hypothetical protein CO251_03625 [Sulfobacillus sp. hq2]PSR35957.1 MAG: hypothetical protein C7B44_11535 [Sulfobacillus thermosulfidooxidans]